MDVDESLAFDDSIVVFNTLSSDVNGAPVGTSLVTLHARRLCRHDINDNTGRERHAGECADGVVVAGVTGENTGFGVVIHRAGFGSNRGDRAVPVFQSAER